jgi:hypothetical protein
MQYEFTAVPLPSASCSAICTISRVVSVFVFGLMSSSLMMWMDFAAKKN